MTASGRLIVSGECLTFAGDGNGGMAADLGALPVAEPFGTAVAAAADGRGWIDVMLGPPDVHALRLDRRPVWPRRSLRVASPLELGHIRWSRPDAAGTIVIARRERLDAITAWLARNALPPPRFVDPRGIVIGADPARTAIFATLAIVLAALSSIPFTTFALRNSSDASSSMEKRSASLSPAIPADRPTLAATIATVARQLPEDTPLVAVARSADGRLSLTIDSPDPDRLRAAMRAQPSLGRLQEEAQRRTELGTLRISYAEPRTPGRSPSQGAPPTSLRAGTAGLRARLARDAAAAAVAIEFAPAQAPAGLVATALTARGPQAAILALAERIETRPPAARLLSWTLAADLAGVRLTGVAAEPR